MKGALALAGYWNGAKDSTETPKWLYDELDSEFHFDFDPCPLNPSPTFDGLKVDWGNSNYVNPPYSNKTPWVIKSCMEYIRGKTVVMLLPVDPSSKWYYEWIHPYASQIRLLSQRLIFPPNKTHAAYSSMVVIFNKIQPTEKYTIWRIKQNDIKT